MKGEAGSGRRRRGCLAWLQVAFAAACSFQAVWAAARDLTATDADFGQRAYVWQRVWTPAVCRAVAEHAHAFSALDVIAAEVSFAPTTAIDPHPDWTVLRETAMPVGLVVRIGRCESDWSASAPATATVVAACLRVMSRAREHGVDPAELQLDFDAATTHLAAYRALLEQIRARVAPRTLVITALPSWMDSPDFAALVGAVDAYGLQVHSLQKPTLSTAPFTLFEGAAAKRWVAQAATFGRPFRVALPTYGYAVGFRPDGAFLGLQAETAARAWPAGTTVRTVCAKAAAVAEFVDAVVARHPPACVGIAWFRLPTEEDVLAWRWPTFAAVMRGERVRPELSLHTRTGANGALDLILSNDGTADATTITLRANWPDAQVLAFDAIGGWRMARGPGGTIVLRRSAPDAAAALAPGESVTVGWVRLDRPAAVVATPF